MKISTELREVTKTTRVKESFEYMVLETVDDLESTDFHLRLREASRAGIEFRHDIPTRVRLSPELDNLLKSKMELDQELYIRLSNGLIFIRHEEVDPFKSNSGSPKSQIHMWFIEESVNLDYFRDEKS